MADYLHGWELQVNSTIQITYNAVGDVKGATLHGRTVRLCMFQA
jgi:hypothetical protein